MGESRKWPPPAPFFRHVSLKPIKFSLSSTVIPPTGSPSVVSRLRSLLLLTESADACCCCYQVIRFTLEITFSVSQVCVTGPLRPVGVTVKQTVYPPR
ncbi:hypothetical protein MRX96_025645 [Rhipicephalus microplus]